LASAGATLDDVAKVTVYITDIDDFDAIHEVRREFFMNTLPASTMVEVSKLVHDDMLIEIEAVPKLNPGDVRLMSEPLVYRNFTQAELNDAYNQATLVPDISDHQARQAEETASARELLPCRLGVSYGPTDAEYIDVYGEADGSRPVMIYTHSGA
jgi:hypothetical protein